MPQKHPHRNQLKYTRKRYRVRNWKEYEAGLGRRGDLTIWFSATGNLRSAESPADSVATRTLPFEKVPGLFSENKPGTFSRFQMSPNEEVAGTVAPAALAMCSEKPGRRH